MCIRKTAQAAGWIVVLMLTLPLCAVLANPSREGAYGHERLRHGRIRSGAEALSNHPRMSRYDVQAAEARIDDDREMKKFDRQARTASGSAAAAPKLRIYNDSLEKTIEKMLDYVRR